MADKDFVVKNGIVVSGNLTLSSTSAIIANSSTGSNGQVLTSNGSASYWSNAGGGFNLDGGAPDSIYGGITSICLLYTSDAADE